MNISFERIAAALALLGGVQVEALREIVIEQTQDESLANRICDVCRRIKPLLEEADHDPN